MNKVALITGAAKRIGAAIARCLHESGLDVVIHYHESEIEAEHLLEELNTIRSNSAIAFGYDLQNDIYKQLIQDCIDHFGRLDVLINNASVFFPATVEDLDIKQWELLTTVNIKAPCFLIKHAATELAKRNGCVINLADIHGERPLKNYPVYSVSKAGLLMLTKAMAKELAPSVRVNAISPGAIDWPSEMTKSTQNIILDKIALEKSGTEVDITNAVTYLIEHADYVTGQVITVDGGRSLHS